MCLNHRKITFITKYDEITIKFDKQYVTALKSPSLDNFWLPADRMGYFSRSIIFFVYLDGFINFSCQQSAS